MQNTGTRTVGFQLPCPELGNNTEDMNFSCIQRSSGGNSDKSQPVQAPIASNCVRGMESVPFLCGVAKSRRDMKSQSSFSLANSVSRLHDAAIVRRRRKLKEERVRVFSAVLIESEQCELES
jgi:hypothetical protein